MKLVATTNNMTEEKSVENGNPRRDSFTHNTNGKENIEGGYSVENLPYLKHKLASLHQNPFLRSKRMYYSQNPF